ncbi:hypothetical protein SELMODRAFT_77859 [Selaginella moellendorffii]|uniref:Pentacotripeptide-repeat region of PRORP domain-containing protein n=1 Tax=Selaginella moellendorffii TaxID=88036 RepID=D8QVZ6_SELML|nr:hypothetical protein SELMODRAFT_77859 [Selaginella moellendorffii]
MITAYAQNGRLEEAKEIFDRSPQRTMVTYNAMVTAYSQNGHLQRAKALFDGMEQRDIVSWNAMLAAYAQSGHDTQTVDLFKSMDIDGVTPNHVSLISALDACGRVGELRLADALYDAALTLGGYAAHLMVATSVVDMYGKCGDVAAARRAFDAMLERDVVAWNAMVAAYSHNGHGHEALEIFRTMDLEGVNPSESTFVSLVGCSRSGFFEESRELFLAMQDCGLDPNGEHFHCMVDLLCRAGKLREARDLIVSMPFEADFPAWSALVSACSVHGDSKLGREVANEVISLVPEDSGLYVCLSKVFSSAGMQDEVARLEQKRKDLLLKSK